MASFLFIQSTGMKFIILLTENPVILEVDVIGNSMVRKGGGKCGTILLQARASMIG